MEQNSRKEKTEKQSSENNNNVNSLQARKVSKKQKPARKLQNLGTRISADTLERFKNYLLINYGKINGPFSKEVEKALELLMCKQHQTTSSVISMHKSAKSRADVNEKFRLIAVELKQLNSYPDINPRTLQAVVKTVLGDKDPRTLKKYLMKVVKLSKEKPTPNGFMSLFDVTKFIEKVQSDAW